MSARSENSTYMRPSGASRSRAWHSGPSHRDIVALFMQARERLAPDGRMYVLFSDRADLDFLRALMEQAGFQSRLVGQRSILIDTFVIYELEAG